MYYGNRMHIPQFQPLKFHLVEGCCEVDGTRLVQYVRVSLNPSNGRRIGSIPRIIEQYNGMVGSGDVINPVVLFPDLGGPIKCFKTTDPIDANPILKRIAEERKKEGGTFWRWTSSAKNNEIPPEQRVANHVGPPVRRQFITSIQDILHGMQLPESVVSVQRVYDELSEPYFREFNVPMGEGTGCIPLEHRDFVVSEIKRRFEEELNYIEQPSVTTLPLRARALVDNAGWMGDILLSGERMMDASAGGAIVRAIRAENVVMRRQFTRTGGQRAHYERLDRRGVGHSLREFLVYYALKWNDEGLASVSKSVQELHSGWIPPLEGLLSLQGLVAGINLGHILTVDDGSSLNVPSVDRLLKLLCDEGLISQVTSRQQQQTPALKRMVVREQTAPVSAIIGFFKQMLGEWADKDTVEVTAADVVRVLNGGDVGVYRKSCVSQFMRPFLFDGSVEGYTWKEGPVHHEKYLVHVPLVALKVAGDQKS